MDTLWGWVVGAELDSFIGEKDTVDVGLNDWVEENRDGVDRVEVGGGGVRVDRNNECDVRDVVVRALEKRCARDVRDPLNVIVHGERARVVDKNVRVRDRVIVDHDSNELVAGVTHLQ